jgi:hypothetical protein
METTKLEKLRACSEAIMWAKTHESPSEAWQNCARGDWMLFIAQRLGVDDKKLTMAKAMIAKQVEHLMQNQQSKDTLRDCFNYVSGVITREQLNAAVYLAYVAAYAVYAASDAAYAAASAADTEISAYYAAIYAANAYAVYAASDAAYTAASAADTEISAYYAATYAANAYAANAVAYSAAYPATARQESLRKSADICREYLTDEVLEKYEKL